MENNSFDKAMEDFIGGRIADCGMGEHESLQACYQEFEQAFGALKETLSPAQEKLFVKLENAYSLADGEAQNCYYRVGFSDAVLFLLGWRDGKWN